MNQAGPDRRLTVNGDFAPARAGPSRDRGEGIDGRIVGAAPTQVDAFLAEVQQLTRRVPEALGYRPASIL